MSGKETKMKSQVGRKKSLVLSLILVVVAFTAWIILGTVSWSANHPRSSVPPTIIVPVDIKPGYCPNPLEVYGSGDVSVAILGTEKLAVTEIARDSVRLQEIPPLRSEIRDVAKPFGLYRWQVNENEVKENYCSNEGPDGKPDLVLYFSKEQILKAVGSTTAGDVLVLRVTARHKSGALIVGQDVVVIKK
jgi:hypothetical protein